MKPETTTADGAAVGSPLYWVLMMLCLLSAWTGAVSAQGVAYVPIASSFVVDVIDLRDGHRVSGIPVAGGPIGVAVDAKRGRVYVAHQLAEQLTVISTSSRAVIASVPLPGEAWGVVLSRDGATAYVSVSELDQVAVVDTATNTVTGTIAVGVTPRGLAVSPSAPFLYVANQNGASVSIVNLDSGQVVATVPTPGFAFALAVSPDGQQVYAATANALLRIDTATMVETGRIELGDYGAELALTADGTRLYVSVSTDNEVVVIDTSTFSLLTSIPVQGGPYGISVSADGSRVYTVNVGGENLSVIDTGSNTVIGSFALTGAAFAAGNPLAPATVPDAPDLMAAEAGNNSASLMFAAPEFDGGSPVSGYVANCNQSQGSGPGSPIQVGSLINGVVHRCVVRAINGAGSSLPSAPLSAIPGNTGTIADLAISNTNNSAHVIGGLPTTYVLRIDNPGPAHVAGARVTDNPGEAFSAISWTCAASNGALCPAASGSGDLNSLVDLPIGSHVQFQLTATVQPLPEDPVFNIASVSAPAAIQDNSLQNNVATDGPDTRGLLRDRFE